MTDREDVVGVGQLDVPSSESLAAVKLDCEDGTDLQGVKIAPSQVISA